MCQKINVLFQSILIQQHFTYKLVKFDVQLENLGHFHILPGVTNICA